MNTNSNFSSWMSDAVAYGIDFWQRSAIYMDILRQRGNSYLEHNRQGMPPVLTFDYEVILDGRHLQPATNYQLARIQDRRNADATAHAGTEKRRLKKAPRENPAGARPIIILDPRAGGGPGIGGFKQDSQIGMALNLGHPVYFVLFTPEPVTGQTLADVQKTLVRFVKTVSDRHPDARKPAIIGNCQAGWAVAILGALEPDQAGPIIMNGAPLSFWAGVAGKNPMRYRGGWTGGVWLASLWSDLGNGMFDGASLLAGFEDLNLSRTLWEKQYYLWTHIDTEEERYLEFEKWWNGFFKLTGKEIHFIVDELFIGNRLEKGQVTMDGRRVDLRSIRGPIFVFASRGDNITPPQQALNWIPAVWGSVEEMRREKKVIIYMLHESIGHLGIFVSGPVSKKEHREMISSIDQADLLAPGLYEMIISETDDGTPYDVRFEARDMGDIRAIDDDGDDESVFGPVARLSTLNDILYRLFVRPLVQTVMNETLAEGIRQLHPLRTSKYGFSDLNPWMQFFKTPAEHARNNRRAAVDPNRFVAMEKKAAAHITSTLDFLRDARDLSQEIWFQSVYHNPWLQAGFSFTGDDAAENGGSCRAEWVEDLAAGGFAEAVVRIISALSQAAGSTDRRVLDAFGDIFDRDERLSRLGPEALTDAVKKQACILAGDTESAIEALTTLLPDPDDRRAALALARGIFPEDEILDPQVQARLDAISAAMGIPE
ncbi:MAG: DUF3141 domain-containing protein [Deltaproteobacteria bacterium]|nr:DUF3141 domain-containing protein [Deltaproteobacteria bacterium]